MVRKKMHRRLYNNFCSSYSEVTQSESRSDSTYLNVMEVVLQLKIINRLIYVMLPFKEYLLFSRMGRGGCLSK